MRIFAAKILSLFCGRIADPFSALQRFLYLLVTLHILDSMPHNSFDDIQSPARAQELCVDHFDGWLATNRHTHNPESRRHCGWSANRKLDPADYFRVARHSDPTLQRGTSPPILTFTGGIES
jgi:hypothetical protein